jgi:hypothetical protein
MDSVKEFFQSIVDSYTDRIKSPFIGSFMLSFLIFNWRVFAILLFSEWPIHCRIEWIENKYCIPENFWYPLIIALFYILILPYINLGFEWLLSMYSNKKRLKSNFSRKEDLIRRKGEANLLREIADAKAGTSEITTLNERLESLQIENKNLTTQNQEDLTRHNTASEQSKVRENSYKDQIRIYAVQTSLVFSSSELFNREDATYQNTKDMIKIADSLSDASKSKFEKMVLNYKNTNKVRNIEELANYEKLGLVQVLEVNKDRSTFITPMGNLLFEYLRLGLDLS